MHSKKLGGNQWADTAQDHLINRDAAKQDKKSGSAGPFYNYFTNLVPVGRWLAMPHANTDAKLSRPAYTNYNSYGYLLAKQAFVALDVLVQKARTEDTITKAEAREYLGAALQWYTRSLIDTTALHILEMGHASTDLTAHPITEFVEVYFHLLALGPKMAAMRYPD